MNTQSLAQTDSSGRHREDLLSPVGSCGEQPGSRPAGRDLSDIDLAAVLAAWETATNRLKSTHEALSEEVRRLTEELEVKNRQLARKNRLADLGQIASHVAHEVRNNLVPMTLYLSLLRRRLAQDSDAMQVMDKIESGFSALQATVTDLLQFTSARDPERASFEVAGLVREVCESVAPRLSDQGVRLETRIPARQTIHADREMLRRALLNLILNALDAMPDGGVLTILCREEETIQLEVADSGAGFPVQLQDQLFEPFFTTKSHGTGLGLAIVDQIARAHGGYAACRNSKERGAVFSLGVPPLEREEAT